MGFSHVPQVERAPVRPVLRGRVVDVSQQLCGRRQLVGSGHVGHLVRVVEAAVDVLERGDHRQDRLAELQGVHAPGGERAAVAKSLDRELDRLGGVARAEEVSVHRVHRAVPLHGPGRRDQRLAEHLAAEDPAVRLLLAVALEEVLAPVVLAEGP